MKKQSGITLIALVITIIVMLILAGVSLNVLVGDNGVLTQAQEAKYAHEEAERDEFIEMAIAESQMNTYPDIDYETLQSSLKNYFGEDARVDKYKNKDTGVIDYVISLPNGYTRSLVSNVQLIDIFIEEDSAVNGEGIGVIGYQLELNQKIGLRFYFTMPDKYLNSGAKIKLVQNTVLEGEKLTEIDVDNAYLANVDGKECYFVTNYCAAKEMVDDITFSIYDESDNPISKEYTYSIKKYGDAVINDSKIYKTEDKVEYVKALLYFGGMAQKYFAERFSRPELDDNLASKDINVDTSYINDDYLTGYTGGIIGDSEINYFANPAVVLHDEILLKIYLDKELTSDIKDEEKIAGAIVDGEYKELYWGVDLSGAEGYYFEFPVKITEFDRMFDIYIIDTDNNIVGEGVTYGIYAYLNEMLSKYNDDVTLERLFKDLAKSMIYLSECGHKIFK